MKPTHLLSLLSLLLALHATPAAAETATTTQDINLGIPVVALLDVEDITPTFTFNAPTNAGDPFTLSASANQPSVAVSSNNPNAKLDVRLTQNLTPFGFDIALAGSGLGSCSSNLLLSTNNQTLCNVGGLQTNSGQVTVNIDTSAGNGMAAHGNYAAEIVYTLTEN